MSNSPFFSVTSPFSWPGRLSTAVSLSTEQGHSNLGKTIFNFCVPKIVWVGAAICSVIACLLAIVYNISILLPVGIYWACKGNEQELPQKESSESIENTKSHTPFLSDPSSDNITNTHLPVTFPKSTDTPPPECSSEMIEYIEKHSDAPSTQFFLEKGTLPNSEIRFWNVFQSPEADMVQQEEVIPLLFPGLLRSNSSVPIIPLSLSYLIRTNPAIASKYLLGVLTFLSSQGIILNKAKKWQLSSNSTECIANRQSQDQKNIYQVLESLGACGFGDLAYELEDFLLEHQSTYQLSAEDIKRPIQQIKKLGYVSVEDGSSRLYWISQQASDRAATDLSLGHGGSPTPEKCREWVVDVSKTAFNHANCPNKLLLWNQEQNCWHLPHLRVPPQFVIPEKKK